MAGTTTNNGWTYPTSTDLVTNGASAIQTLATGIDTSTGKGLIAWQTWSPTLSAGWANGNGTWSNARYALLGKIVIAKAQFLVGSTTTKGTTMRVSLPTAANASNTMVGSAELNAGGTSYLGGILATGTGTADVRAYGSAGAYVNVATVSATVPGTWATGDIVYLNFYYEAA